MLHLFANKDRLSDSSAGLFNPIIHMCECTGNGLLGRFITCVFACLLFIATAPTYAAVAGDILDTDAEVRYSFNGQVFSKTDNAPLVVSSLGDGSGAIGTPAAIDIWSPATTGSENINAPVSSCATITGTIDNANLTLANGSPLSLPSSVNALQASTFKSGQPLIVRVIDLDQNLNSTIADTVTVTLQGANGSKDSETLILTESSNNSGEFIGIIQTARPPEGTQADDCVLSLGTAAQLNINYRDQNDNEDSVSASLKFDPLNRIFDAFTGAPLNDVQISLVDARTGEPAQVFGDDGSSNFPSVIVSGSTVTDSSGNSYTFDDGEFRFPYVANGNYRIEIEETTILAFPSEVSDEVIQALPSAPYLLSDISRGSDFLVNNQVVEADLPLDPKSDRILLEKTSTKTDAGNGDFVPFTIRVNNAESDANDIQLVDTLPLGLTYVKGSLVIGGEQSSAIEVSNTGRNLIISLPAMEASESLDVQYVTKVSATAKGLMVNEVYAQHPELKSNTAKASIQFRDDFFRLTSRLFGRVILDDCEGNLDAEGVSGVRLYMEDGTYVVTDQQGEWHIEGVKPGSHVVQIDTETLPPYLEPVICEDSFFHAGQAYSQFVDIQPGSLWRADFHVRVKQPEVGEVVQTLKNELVPFNNHEQYPQVRSPVKEKIKYSISIRGDVVALQDVREFIMLPTGVMLEPGSLLVDGEPAKNYEASGNSILINFGNKPKQWSHEIEFYGLITSAANKGKLTAKARLFYKAGLPNSQWTPDAETNALLYLPPADGKADPVTPPRFANFADQLTNEDKQNLADVVNKLEGLQNLNIAVVGHTDNIPIARHNRHIFEDNQALSEARATSVASYLSQQLSLPIEDRKSTRLNSSH